MNDIALAASKSVSGTELMRHCREFAKRIKLSGTPEELESFRYLKSCLDGYGYRTALIAHDAYISLPARRGSRWTTARSRASPIPSRGRRPTVGSRPS